MQINRVRRQLIRPYRPLREPYAWRQWQFLWEAREKGEHTLMARAFDTGGRLQPMQAEINAVGYGNNGVREHAVQVTII